ncbi:sensor histidine kinase [Qipengyuania sp. ASV99]|uniref:sensor histidine kinase n=1 Tax=Qipengyuania sp. ASV99 TaxID=3399681 RepID=UPI003A4C59E2
MVGAIGLSLVLVLGLWFVTHQSVTRTLQEAALSEIDVDIAGLVDIYASNGQAELEQRIADRLALTPAEGSTPHYLLANDRGARIVGDIAGWPGLDPMTSESGIIAIGSSSTGFARAVQLGPDLRLLVARRMDGNNTILTNIALVFALGGTVFVALVALLGRLAALNLQRRIGQINSAFRTPDGPIALPMTNARKYDEIDELTSHSAAALARVRDLMEAYKDTSEQLAHEIRTPLSHLDNRLLKALKENPGAEVAERLIEARAEIKRLVQTLESLLDIAASKTRRGDRAGLAQVDFSALVTRICDLYAGSAEETGHELVCDVEPGVVIQGEERQIGRLVTNILDNAFKYVPPGGRVEVRLSPGPELVIADDGPGIAPSDRERVFERFYRGRGSIADAHGSGLGLALAQAIAERHGLTLSLDETAKGSSFRLRK